MSRNPRRASSGVVDFGGYGLEDHVGLEDVDEQRERDEDMAKDKVLPDLSKALPYADVRQAVQSLVAG